MEIEESPFKKYIFVCENESDDKKCCAPAGNAIREQLKSRIKELGLSAQIRVSRSGCLDVCVYGPNVLIMPDNIWYKQVQNSDIPQILEKITQSL